MALQVMSNITGIKSKVGNPSSKQSVAIRQSASDLDLLTRKLNDSSSDHANLLEQIHSHIENSCISWLGDRQDVLTGLLKIMSSCLLNADWEVRLNSISILVQLIGIIDPKSMDETLSPILQHVIPCLGDGKVAIRRATVDCMHAYMKHTNDFANLMQHLARYGAENDDADTQRNCIITLSQLIRNDMSQRDFHELVTCLAKKLLAREEAVCKAALDALEKIRLVVGEHIFITYLNRLSSPLRKYYYRVAGRDPEQPTVHDTDSAQSSSLLPTKISFQKRNSLNVLESLPTGSTARSPVNSRKVLTSLPSSHSQSSGLNNDPSNDKPTSTFNPIGKPSVVKSSNSLVFGIIPRLLMNQLDEGEDFRVRAQAVEELKIIVRDLDNMEPMLNNLPSLFTFLNSLLEDNNFKIVTVTLDIFILLVTRIGQGIEAHQRQLILAISKRLSDNKIVVRQGVMKLVMLVMQVLTPENILTQISENLTNRNSKVRQETLNIIIASLLTFPSIDFNLPSLCSILGPCLIDSKRQVRHTSLECIAVLAQGLGAGKLAPLVQAVEAVEASMEGSGVMQAVQARLARRQLPRLGPDGLVEYANPVPSSAGASRRSTVHGASMGGSGGGNSSSRLPSADEEWVMAAVVANSSSPAGGSTSGKLKQPTEHLELEGLSTGLDGDNRALSNRHTKNSRGPKLLPWNPAQEGGNSHQMTSPNTDRTPAQPPSSPVAASLAPQKKAMGASTVESTRTNKPVGTYMKSPTEPALQNSGEGPKRSKLPRAGGGNARGNRCSKRVASVDQALDDAKQQAAQEQATGSSRTLRPNGYYRQIARSTDAVDLISGNNDAAPLIPQRPALARSAGKRSRRSGDPVPPIGNIPLGASVGDATSSVGSVEREVGPSGETSDISSSLAGIRSSASKKKANKVFAEAEKRVGPYSSAPATPQNNMNHGPVKASIEQEIQFSTSMNQPFFDDDDSFEWRTGGAAASRERGLKGLTNPSSNAPNSVPLYLEDMLVGDMVRETPLARQIRSSSDARQSKSSLDAVEMSVVGKLYGSEVTDDRRGRPSLPADHRFSQRPHFTDSYSLEYDDYTDRYAEEEESMSPNKSRFFQDSLISKTRKKQHELDNKQKENNLEKRRLEAEEREKETLRRISYNGHDGETLNEFPSNKETLNRQKPSSAGDLGASKYRSKPKLESTYSSPGIISNPDRTLSQALSNLSNSDWQIKCDALASIRELANKYPETLAGPEMHSLTLAVGQECKNLRSQVSRAAIQTVTELFVCLRRRLDPEADHLGRILLHKTGETSGFICEDVDRGIEAMISGVSAPRAMITLVMGGVNHKNLVVRRAAAQHMCTLAETLGPQKVLSGAKDITDRLLVSAAQFVLEGKPETRFYGRKIFSQLIGHPDFDAVSTKYIPESTWRNIKEIIDNLRLKGLGDPPSCASSASLRRGNSLNRGGSAGSIPDVVVPISNVGPSPGGKAKQKAGVRMSDSLMDDVRRLTSSLGANDWRERYDAITELVTWCESSHAIVNQNIVKIFDNFIPRMLDSNSKVKLHALESLQSIIPIVSGHILPVLTRVVQNTAQNLASNNQEMVTLASGLLDDFINEIEGGQLLQAFVQTVSAGNPRVKPDMIRKLASLADAVCPHKPKLVLLHVQPEMCRLLLSLCGGEKSKGIKEATQVLVSTLYFHLGEDLVLATKQNVNATPNMIQLLAQMIETS